MKPTSHHREVIAWLEAHGAERVRLTHDGAPHPRISYLWDGAERTHVVPGTTRERRTALNTITQLRRVLGDPAEVCSPERQKRKMEDMMPQVDWKETLAKHPAVSAKTYPAKVARYGRQLRVTVPQEVREFLAGRCVVGTEVAPDRWSFLPDDAAKRPSVNNSGQIDVVMPGEPFGACAAEVTIEADHFTVRRTSTAPLRKFTKPRPVLTVHSVESDLGLTSPTLTASATETEIRETLATIRRIEAGTAYRLIKVKDTGVWLFQSRIE